MTDKEAEESEARIKAVILLKKGLELAGAGRAEGSAPLLDEVIRLDPGCAEAYDCKGLVMMQLKKYDVAFACFEQALKLEPNNARFWYDKSLLFRELGMVEDEAQACLTSLKHGPGSVQAWH